MFTHRHRIAAPPPTPSPPLAAHASPSFVPNRHFLPPHLNGKTQNFRSNVFNNLAPPFKQFIGTSSFQGGLSAVYGFPGELDHFEYSRPVGKHSYCSFSVPDYGPLRHTWQDVGDCKDNDVSTEFAQTHENHDSNSNGFYRPFLPTDENFLSPHESGSDSESSSSDKSRKQSRSSNWNWRNRTQYDSDAPSSDEFSDESSEYYDSDSEDEWSFPRNSANGSPPFGLTLKEAALSYQQRWNAMLTQRGGSNHWQLVFETVPWPQYPPPKSPAEINHRSIRDFLCATGGSSNFMLKTIFRQTMLRFHPDKSAVLLAHVDERHRRVVFEGCTAVARCLNDIKDLF